MSETDLVMYYEKNDCRCCGGTVLLPYLDLGSQPLANHYHKGEGANEQIPLKVNFCPRCYHSQLSVVVDPSVMFTNYLYVSGTTSTLKKHFDEFASYVRKKLKPHKFALDGGYGFYPYREDLGILPMAYVEGKQHRPLMLDIACNDGTMLETFQNKGFEVYGVDPAKNLHEITKSKGLNVTCDYWNRETFEGTALENTEFDVITACNVFAHVDNISEFLAACYCHLNDTGYAMIELPYNRNLIIHNEFDTVYHEHLSYFLVHSFRQVAKQNKLVIVDIVESDIHGGSIRFVLMKQMAGVEECEKVKEFIDTEYNLGLYSFESYRSFGSRVLMNKIKMAGLVDSLKQQGKRVVGYGASAKGNTMLNYCQAKLDYIVDDNPLKHGYQTPGMNIPIVPVDTLKEKGPIYIVILSWNFYEEIKSKIKDKRPKEEYGTTILIRYVPEVIVEEI